MRDLEQRKVVQRFQTYLDYDKNVPKDVGTSGLDWLTMRTPYCVALTSMSFWSVLDSFSQKDMLVRATQ